VTTETHPHVTGGPYTFQGSGVPQSPLSLIWVDGLQRIWTIALSAVATALLGILFTLLLQPRYTATASFIPDAGQGLSGALGGFVGQLAGLQGGGMSPRLAGDLATGEAVLTRALYERFPISGAPGSDSVRLIDNLTRPGILDRVFGVERDSARLEAAALKSLKQFVDADVNERTGVVDIIVSLSDPRLSSALANRLLDLVDSFNQNSTQTRARSLRRFLDGRLEVAAREVSVAENRLQTFYSENRRYSQSPEQLVNEAHLRAELESKRSVLATIMQQLEQARIDEVRDTPVLTRVRTATPPVKKSFPRKSVFAVLGFLLGAVAAFGVGAFRSFQRWYAMYDPAMHARFSAAIEHVQKRARLLTPGRRRAS